MNHNGQGIRGAWERVHRLERLSRRQRNLDHEIAGVEVESAELERRLAAEQKDVARLRGIGGLRAQLAGDRDVRLVRERVEAEAARLRVEGHQGRLQRLYSERQAIETEREELPDVRGAYERALVGHPSASELSDVGFRLVVVESDVWEHEEALTAGGNSRQAARALADALRRVDVAAARDASFAGLLHQGALGSTDRAAWTAEQALAEFGLQLTDLGIQLRVQLPPADLKWFTERFFDESIGDVTRRRRLLTTIGQVEAIERWAAGMLDHLTTKRDGLIQSRNLLRSRWEAMLG